MTTMQPLPPGATRNPLVTADVTAWALEVLHDAVRYPMGAVAGPRVIGGRVLVARVEVHTNGTAENPAPHAHRGISTYLMPAPTPPDSLTPVVIGEDEPTTDRTPEALARGIDCSDFQPHVDWQAVAAAGFSFVFVKAQEGVTVHAKLLTSHWAGAAAAGLLRGAYHFFRTTSDPAAQVREFLADMDAVEATHGRHELPLVLDVEAQKNGDAAAQLGGLSPVAFLDRVEAWVGEYESRRGVAPLIYCGPGLWNALPKRGGIESRCALWLADYTPPATLPGSWTEWRFWQTSDREPVPGIGPTDVNLFSGSRADLLAYAVGAQGDPETGARILRIAADIDGGVEGLDAFERLNRRGDLET